MGIKFGSIILTILFLFVAKISFEATTDTASPAGQSRGPASVSSANSIDHDYAVHMQGHHAKN